jgi:elongation factor Ts
MEISAKTVMELRQRTGVGMMDCKKALLECNGDMEAAVDWLRAHGLAKAAKKADRAAKDGLIRIHKTGDRAGAMMILNCETDFVSRSDDFQQLANDLVAFFASAELPKECFGAPAPAEHLGKIVDMSYKEGRTIKDFIGDAVGKIGENIQLGQLVVERSGDAGDFLQDYIHGNRVGVLVCLTAGKAETLSSEKFHEVAKDIAMQAAAGVPAVAVAVDRSSVPVEQVEHERNVLLEQAKAEGKKPEIAEKMVEGRLNKFYEEVCLLEQPFIKDDKVKVKDMLAAAGQELGDSLSVARFHRFQLGE